jgi:hypothetical protein
MVTVGLLIACFYKKIQFLCLLRRKVCLPSVGLIFISEFPGTMNWNHFDALMCSLQLPPLCFKFRDCIYQVECHMHSQSYSHITEAHDTLYLSCLIFIYLF